MFNHKNADFKIQGNRNNQNITFCTFDIPDDNTENIMFNLSGSNKDKFSILNEKGNEEDSISLISDEGGIDIRVKTP